MSIFDQKPRFSSRPLEWLYTGGRSIYGTTDRFLRQLTEELNSRESGDDQGNTIAARLLPLRGEFRRVMEHSESVPALELHRFSANPVIRAIAIWLLSHHASRFSLHGIDDLCHDNSQMVRKRVARALWKLEARQLLMSMAQDYPDDEAIQWYSTWVPSERSHHERLIRYMRTMNATQHFSDDQPSRMPLWFRDEYWSGSPPKSIEYVRMLLRRIQALVHG